MSSSAGVNEVVVDLAGFTSVAVGFSSQPRMTGSLPSSGLTYFQVSPPAAIDLTMKIHESQCEGRSRMTVLAVAAMVIGPVYWSGELVQYVGPVYWSITTDSVVN